MSESPPPEVEAIDFIERWRRIVERRRVQMESAYADAGISNNDYWGKRAKNYRQALHSRTDADPFFLHVRSQIDATTTVMDVGAGTGRHTLALAPYAARVTAVDPSAAMLGFLREDLAAGGVTNVDVIEGAWLDADAPAADVVICSHVLYPIADVIPFVRKLEASARQRVYVYLRIDPLGTDLGLWREFHGVPLQQQPTALDLFGGLVQAGIVPDVAVVEHAFTWTFASLDEAVPQVSNSLCLRDDDAAAAAKVRSLLTEILVPLPDGRVGPEIGSTRSAILSWTPAPSA